MFNTKRFLVTGGAGFIGTQLIKHLLNKYEDCVILSVDNYFTGLIENHITDPRVTYLACCTTEINQNASTVNFSPDIVFHLGEFSRIVKSFDDIEECHKFNMAGTFQVLLYCRKTNARLVYAASSSKFGNNGEDQHLSPYAWMKAKNIELINNWHHWYGLDFVITYFYNVYGPGQIMSGDYAAVIGRFQQQVIDNQPITVVAPGTQRRDFTNVEDIVRGIVLAAEKGSGDGYLLGTGKNYTLLEIAEAFDHPYMIIPERKGERFSGQAYPSKAEEELGWVAEHNIIEYIKNWKKEFTKP
jgi:UDP-glucose 4-epimerase